MASANSEQHAFKTEIQELLHLIVNTLYTRKEIFLRELLSNASDALSKIQFETLTNPDVYDKDQPLEITIKIDKKKRFLTITDTGVGMTRAQLIEDIGTIAHSGTKSFVQAMLDSKDKTTQADLIGQFGVGFYSVFMVSDRVSIDSKSAMESEKAVRWESDGKGAYTISESPRRRRGTEITLHIKKEHDEFLEPYRIKELVKQYSNYLPFPVRLEDEQVSEPQALWRRPKKDNTDEQYKEFYRQIGSDYQDPLHWEHLVSEAPVQFSSIVFIPKTAPFEYFGKPMEHGLKLYAKRVFIQDDCKPLLPSYLRFLKGVVDSEDIPLNVSRESIQNDRNILKINKIITKKVLDALQKMAEKDPKTYLEFWDSHGRFIKEGAHSDQANQDKLMPLLRFYSTKQTESPTVSLEEYVAEAAQEQKAIYYAVGESLDRLRKSPHLEFFEKKEITVLLVTDPLDDLVLTHLGEYKSLKIVNVESGDLQLPESLQKDLEEVEIDDGMKKLSEKVRQVLQDKVNKVQFSRRLSEAPCRFFSSEGGMSHSVKKMMLNFDGKTSIPLKRDLELNPDHQFVRALADRVDQEGFDRDVQLLYHLANLLEGTVEEPQELAELIMPLLR